MAKDKGNRKHKGAFGDVRLPVAKEYVYPGSRNWMFIIGGVGALLIFGVFAFNTAIQKGTLISNGPLSSNHAGFGDQCSTCHNALGDVTNDKCMVCHEKYGDEVGVHTFTSHYLYRSGDFTRVVPSENEAACFTCHNEHVGRDNAITAVTDDQCAVCHEFESFNDGHPEFAFVGDSLSDPGNLKFPHTLHVLQVRARQGVTDAEQTCLYCHTPDTDGKNFQPLSFEKACNACHLTTVISTDWLDTSSGDGLGVATLETIRSSGDPGTLWAYYTNPNEFRSRGPQIQKSPVYHEDRWIMENLRRIRAVLYPNTGLADLLHATSDVPPNEAKVLYEEALATLTEYADNLRNQPDRRVQRELDEIDAMLSLVRQRLRDPYAPLDETQFMVSPSQLNESLTPDQIRGYERLADRLTRPCQKCHYVRDATIVRARAEQDQLVRAEFDHRAHIIQQRCLDCHNQIPIAQAAATNTPADRAADHAAIQNLPSIATCQSCHDEKKAANTCITCHLFHPDKSQHANLLLYLE